MSANLILKGKDTTNAFDGKTIHSKFISKAKAHLADIAIVALAVTVTKDNNTPPVDGGNTICPSYSDLLLCVYDVAQQLQNKCGVNHQDRVGILVPGGGASAEYLVSMLAILCCGAVYVPVDLSPNPSQNDKVAKAILTEAKCKALIRTDPVDYLEQSWSFIGTLPSLSLNSVQVLLEKLHDIDTMADEKENVFRVVEGNVDDEACVLFTSGSTGAPKAVTLTHRGIRCRLDWSERITPMVPGDDTILFQLSTTTLGGTMLPLTALLQGSTVFVAKPCLVIDIDLLSKRLQQYRVNFMITMPSLLKGLLKSSYSKEAFKRMKTVYLTGEAYSNELLRAVASACPTADLVNLYGMTETTGHAIGHIYSRDGGTDELVVKMGLPTDNTDAIILDITNQPQAATGNITDSLIMPKVASSGELCVSGIGMSKGYFDKAMNYKNFFDFGGTQFFRTGDIVEVCSTYSGEKTLRYAGRSDRCVKVSGFRVELDGVEDVLNSLPGVSKAAIITNAAVDKSDFASQIIAFVTPGTLDGGKLRSRCLGLVPKHAVPVAIYCLDVFPETVTGKIDRKLLVFKYENIVTKKTELIDATDQVPLLDKISRVIRKSLGGPCGLDTDIFHLGATSITVADIVHGLRPLAISVSEIYRLKSPRKIANWFKVDSNTNKKNSSLHQTNSTSAGKFLHQHISKMLLGFGFISILPKFIPVYLFKLVLGTMLPYLRSQMPICTLELTVIFHSNVEVSKVKASIENAMKIFPLLRARYKDSFFDEEMNILSYADVADNLPFRKITPLNYITERKAGLWRICSGSGSLIEFFFDKNNRRLSLLCDHVICDYTSLTILAKFIVSSCKDEDILQHFERRSYSDFSAWQQTLSKQSAVIKGEVTYGVPFKKKYASLLPFSIKSFEKFQPVSVSSLPEKASLKIMVLSLWHSMCIEFGSPLDIIIAEIKDLRYAPYGISDLEHTFGNCSSIVKRKLTYSPSLSVHDNMTNLEESLREQDESMSVWEKAVGPPFVTFEGWSFNFIDTRFLHGDVKGATFITNKQEQEGKTTREASIVLATFFDEKSISFDIEYCKMNLDRNTVLRMGNCLREKISAFLGENEQHTI